MPSPSHPRLITVSLHRLTSAVIPLSALGLPATFRDTVDLLSSQALNLLNSTSHSLCILPLTTPINLSHYAPIDLSALSSLHTRLDSLGFNCLATFASHPFHLYTPLATLRLPDFLRSSDLLAAPGHLIDLKPSPAHP